MNEPLPECKLDSSRPEEYIHGIFISMENGLHLIRYTQDPKLNTELLSSFIAGLFLFGKESVGCIKEISIKGLNMELLIVYKHGLVLCAIFSDNMVKIDLQSEAEQVLDIFFHKYGQFLPTWGGNIDLFQDFQQVIQDQVENYFMGQLKPLEKTQLAPKSLWDQLIGALESRTFKKK